MWQITEFRSDLCAECGMHISRLCAVLVPIKLKKQITNYGSSTVADVCLLLFSGGRSDYWPNFLRNFSHFKPNQMSIYQFLPFAAFDICFLSFSSLKFSAKRTQETAWMNKIDTETHIQPKAIKIETASLRMVSIYSHRIHIIIDETSDVAHTHTCPNKSMRTKEKLPLNCCVWTIWPTNTHGTHTCKEFLARCTSLTKDSALMKSHPFLFCLLFALDKTRRRIAETLLLLSLGSFWPLLEVSCAGFSVRKSKYVFLRKMCDDAPDPLRTVWEMTIKVDCAHSI